MKKTKTILLLFAAMLSLSILSCRERLAPDVPRPAADALSVQKPAQVPDGGKSAWFPVGTRFEEVPGGINATPPPKWAYLGTTSDGDRFNLKDNTSVSITCTCNQGIGIGICRPFESTGPWGTVRGCYGNCTNCTMTYSLAGQSGYKIQSGGYYSPDAPSRLLKSGETVPSVFDQLFELPEFVSKLEALYKKAYNGKPFQQPIYSDDGTASAPEGYVLVGASIMGRGLVIVVPEEYAKRELGYAYATKASCKCSNRTGTCKLKEKKILGMGSTWCDGTCNGCTLTTDTKASGGSYSYEVSIYSAEL